MKKHILFLSGFCSFFMLMAFAVRAQETSSPKYSNEFLSIGAGARAFGLGNTHTALPTDATAGYWNPAGLAQQQNKYEGTLMHASYFAGIANYDYAAFSYKLDTATTLGASIIRFGVDNIADTRFLFAGGSLDYDRIQTFSVADYALLLSFARRGWLANKLDVGLNFKVIYRSVAQFANAWGFGLDGGVRYQKNNWMVGFMARDVTSTFNAWSYNTTELAQVYQQTNNDIPVSSIEITLPKWLLGIGRQFYIKDKFGIMPTADLELTFDGKRNVPISSDLLSIDPRAGLELSYSNLVFVRGGVSRIQQVKNFDGSKRTEFQPGFGVGLRYKGFQLDYALTDLGDRSEALYSNVFSLSASLNK